MGRPCSITRAWVRLGPRLGTQLLASGLGSMSGSGQETAWLWPGDRQALAASRGLREWSVEDMQAGKT